MIASIAKKKKKKKKTDMTSLSVSMHRLYISPLPHFTAYYEYSSYHNIQLDIDPQRDDDASQMSS